MSDKSSHPYHLRVAGVGGEWDIVNLRGWEGDEEEEKEEERMMESTTHCKPLGWTDIATTWNPRRLLYKQSKEKLCFSCRDSCVAKRGELLGQEFYVLMSIFWAFHIGSMNWLNRFQTNVVYLIKQIGSNQKLPPDGSLVEEMFDSDRRASQMHQVVGRVSRRVTCTTCTMHYLPLHYLNI